MFLLFTYFISDSLYSPLRHQVLQQPGRLSRPPSNQLNHLQLVWHRLRLNRLQSVYLQLNLLPADLFGQEFRSPAPVRTIWILICWVSSLLFLSVLLSVYIRAGILWTYRRLPSHGDEWGKDLTELFSMPRISFTTTFYSVICMKKTWGIVYVIRRKCSYTRTWVPTSNERINHTFLKIYT